MAITNYGELRAALSAYEFHSKLAAQYANATTLFETTANRRLRVRQMETETALTLSETTFEPSDLTKAGIFDLDIFDPIIFDNDYLVPSPTVYAAVLPDDYLLWRFVHWIGRNPFVELDYVHPDYLRSTWVASNGGHPKIFSISDRSFFAQPPDTTPYIFRLNYYRKIPSIVGGGDFATNWLITAYPDVYLFGVLAELHILSRNLEQARICIERRDGMLAEISQLSALTTGPSSPLVRTSEYF